MTANIKLSNKNLRNNYSLQERVKQIRTDPKLSDRSAHVILIEVNGAIQQQWLVSTASRQHLPKVCRALHRGSSVTDFYERITQAPAIKSLQRKKPIRSTNLLNINEWFSCPCDIALLWQSICVLFHRVHNGAKKISFWQDFASKIQLEASEGGKISSAKWQKLIKTVV